MSQQSKESTNDVILKGAGIAMIVAAFIRILAVVQSQSGIIDEVNFFERSLIIGIGLEIYGYYVFRQLLKEKFSFVTLDKILSFYLITLAVSGGVVLYTQPTPGTVLQFDLGQLLMTCVIFIKGWLAYLIGSKVGQINHPIYGLKGIYKVSMMTYGICSITIALSTLILHIFLNGEATFQPIDIFLAAVVLIFLIALIVNTITHSLIYFRAANDN